jgi:hypothetical protein
MINSTMDNARKAYIKKGGTRYSGLQIIKIPDKAHSNFSFVTSGNTFSGGVYLTVL